MREESPTDVQAVFGVLARHDVDYIVVGMVSAVIHGAPTTTFDLDVVYARTDANIPRILAALQELDAYVRIQRGRKLTIDESHLRSAGHKLMKTRFGRVDFLATIGDAEGYDELLAHSSWFDIDGMKIRVLGLAKYITLKEQAGRTKDIAVLPLLRAVLDESGEY